MALAQFGSQLCQEYLNPILFNLLNRLLVHAG
jgi:hypothetical protein